MNKLSPHEELLACISGFNWRSRPDGYVTEFDNWTELTGMAIENSLGEGWLVAIHPDDRAPTMDAWQMAVLVKKPHRISHRIRSVDGSYRWFDTNAVPILGEDGEVAEFLGASIDIHDRIAAQQQRNSVLDNISEAFITIDKNWIITYQNVEGARINAKPAADVIGKHMFDEWPEIPNSELERNYRKAMAEGRPVRFTHRYLDEGKYDVWLEIQAVPSEDGGLGIFYLDITERKRAEIAVVESEARFRQLVDNLRAAFLLTNVGAEKLYYASPYSSELLGVCSKQLSNGMNGFFNTVHPADLEAVKKFVSIKDGQSEISYRLWSDKTGERWVSHQVTQVSEQIAGLEDSENSLAHIITDITEQRLLQGQLQTSQRMESLGRLAGGVAHDFNNILTVIMGRTELVKHRLEQADFSAAAVSVDEVEQAAVRAAGITKQILTFARRQESAPTLMYFNQAIKGSQTLVQQLLGDGIECVNQLSDDTPAVMLDPAQFDQLLVNLAANASSAMGNMGRFTLSTFSKTLNPAEAKRAGLRPGRYAGLSAADTGAGIDPKIQEQIFEPFFSTKNKQGGTGMGLATCYGLVKAAGGAITVKSELNQGTKFEVLLPIAEGSFKADSISSVAGGDGGTESILLVEDEEALRNLLQESLTELGYTVTSTTSPAHAIQWLKSNDPDLLITDMIMPEMTGAALADKAWQLKPDLPVLTISGYPGEDAIAVGVVPATLALLSKPFTPSDLSSRVRSIFDHVAAQKFKGQQ